MATVVFDFDGTLADSFKVVMQIYNGMAATRGYKPIDAEEWEKIRHMSIPSGLRYVGIRPFQIPGLLAIGKKEIKLHAPEIQLFRGIPAMVNELANKGHDLYVLSTNTQLVVNEVLEQAGIADKLHVMKSAPVFGKAAALKKLLRKNRVKQGDMWMVGDELRDGMAARRAGVHFIGVNWGLQPKEVLEKAGPAAIAFVPADIVDAVK